MGTNQFLSFPEIPVGVEGPQAAIDLFTLVPSTGLDPDLTFLGVGNFVGTISIEGSPSAAGDDWSVVAQFESGLDADANIGPVLGFAPVVAQDVVVRRLRLNVRGRIIQPVTVTVGAEQNCDCSSGGGGTGSFESVTGGSGILVIQSPTGTFTVINVGVITASGGTGIAVTPGPTGAIVIQNTGVIQALGTGSIQVSHATGIVTISDVGLFMASAGTGIRLSSATGIVQIDNVGVVLATGGTGIGVSNPTGLVRIDNFGVVIASGGTGIGVSNPTGAINIINTGVVLVTGGTGISVSNSTGIVNIRNTGILNINGATGALGIQSPMLTTTQTATGTVIRLDNGNPLTISLAPTITNIDASRFTSWIINASGNVFIAAPSNPREGEKVTFTIIKNTATGMPLFPTGIAGGYQFASGPLGPLLDDLNSLEDATPSGGFFKVGFEYAGRNNRWVCVALAGFYV